MGDETWNRSGRRTDRAGQAELGILGLVRPVEVERGFVVRMPKAYPFYDAGVQEATSTSCGRWLADNAPNVHPVGRNGMHRYNNQDHSMFTALLTVENIIDGTHHDVWDVNVEEDYHEEVSPGSVTSLADVRKADKVH